MDPELWLSVFEKESYEDSVESLEYHNYRPFSSDSNFANNDEIRISILSEDRLFLPSLSQLYIEGSFETTDDGAKLVNNAYAFLFEEIRYLLSGKELDKTRNVGYASLLKGMATMNKAELQSNESAGWSIKHDSTTLLAGKKKFNATIPLKLLLGFCESYKKLIIKSRQELILRRAHTDDNVIHAENGAITITKIEWRMPHVILSDKANLKLLRSLNPHRPIKVPFRRWELHETVLKENVSDRWVIKTSTLLEKPRFIIFGFSVGKNNNIKSNNSEFNPGRLRNFKLFLNTKSFPYGKQEMDIEQGKCSDVYYDYANFRSNYYNEEAASDPILDYASWKLNPVYVLDCSRQPDSDKPGSTIDVQFEFESSTTFEKNTICYCLLIHDCLIEYNPLTNIVQ